MSTFLSIPYPHHHRDQINLNAHLWSNSLSGPPRLLQCHRSESRVPKDEFCYLTMSYFPGALFSGLLTTGLLRTMSSFLFSSFFF